VVDNFQNPETERLATEVAQLANETKDEAIRQSLRERRDRLKLESGADDRPYEGMLHWLETEIWPQIPPEDLGKPPMSKTEIEEILGYGPEGV
jgi:antitoxin VapB